MPVPLNPQQLQQLEAELAQAEKTNNHLEALDILEDINKRGWAQGRHLLAMGHCYLKIRQRQDAKHCWLRAFAMDANYTPVVEALDKFFPGWENQSEASGSAGRKGRDEEPPPPPPPSSFNAAGTRANLTVETVAPPRHEPPAPAPRPASAAAAQAAPQPARPAPSPVAPQAEPEPEADLGPLPDLDAAFETVSGGGKIAMRGGKPGALPNFEVGAKGVSDARGKINWRVVLEEATEIGAGAGR